MMEISALKVFKAVAETGGVSTAAEKLHYVQSNVTARIKKLEEELGTSLFIRQSRGMVLTPQGRILLEYAENILDMEKQAVRAVQSSLDDGGSLSFGSMETAMAVRLPSILRQFSSLQPQTELSVRTGTTEEMIEQVLHHKLDCAIVGNAVDHEDIIQVPFFDEELILATPKGKADTQTLLVFRQGCVYRARAEQYLRVTGKLPYKVMEFGTLEGIMACVVAGLGMTLLPRSVIGNIVDDVDISTVPADISEVTTYLICHKNTIQTKPMRTLMSLASSQETEQAA